MRRLSLHGLALAIAAGVACGAPDAPPRDARDIVLTPDIEVIEDRVPARATLEGVLRQHELPIELVQAVVVSARGVFNPRTLRADSPYKLVRTLDGLLRRFECQVDADRFLRVVNRGGAEPAIEAEILEYEKTTTIDATEGTIDADHSSLVAALEAEGESVLLAITMAEVFSGDVDFNNDLQPGDRFALVFERIAREGQPAGYGEILAAELVNDGRVVRAFRFAPDGDPRRAGYYDEKGRSLKRFFLSSPLPFQPRITSRFSRRRLHPIHRTYRAHLGVDYGAPSGTSVQSVADGVVVSATYDRANGRMVRIRHGGGYESYYLHLSSFGPGIRAGARVKQGQRIGRVGATGSATGPHLDYRLRKNGVFVNPLTEHRRMPPGEPIPARLMSAFLAERARAFERLGAGATVLAHAPAAAADAPKAAVDSSGR
jgi:murein DD-endopeptidase MepM/ murein hydrolase activator NlpD